MGQNQIAALLGLSRPSVTSGLRELILARLVKKQRNGAYRINKMLAGYATQAESQRAIEDMDVADRMNDPEFWPGTTRPSRTTGNSSSSNGVRSCASPDRQIP
ncbi:hypothetical protein [Streptomyces sp. NPDC058463]|uniref:hypothetical protein n=1 Tax=Streptomyces sp. NPDC058463 TaxID=3346510 RepID=UPI00364E0E10